MNKETQALYGKVNEIVGRSNAHDYYLSNNRYDPEKGKIEPLPIPTEQECSCGHNEKYSVLNEDNKLCCLICLAETEQAAPDKDTCIHRLEKDMCRECREPDREVCEHNIPVNYDCNKCKRPIKIPEWQYREMLKESFMLTGVRVELYLSDLEIDANIRELKKAGYISE